LRPAAIGKKQATREPTGRARADRGGSLKNPRTLTEIADTVEDVQATLEVLVEHLGLQGPVTNAIAARRLKAEQARLEIERLRGFSTEQDGNSRS
jgi:hypothetical protein